MATATKPVVAPGFAPDSVYAEQTREERAITDRLEGEINDHRAWVLGVADENAHHTVRGLCDDSLRRLAKTYRRELEDIADGDLVDSKTGHRTRVLKAKLKDIECEQEYRATLAETWQASERGTHSLTDFQRRGGLAAVLHHGATPPSYDLARRLDRLHFEKGLVHVLDWEAAA